MRTLRKYFFSSRSLFKYQGIDKKQKSLKTIGGDDYECSKRIVENLREFDKVEFKDLKMYYKIEKGLLNPVYTFTAGYYKGNKLSKSEVIIIPAYFNGD